MYNEGIDEVRLENGKGRTEEGWKIDWILAQVSCRVAIIGQGDNKVRWIRMKLWDLCRNVGHRGAL